MSPNLDAIRDILVTAVTRGASEVLRVRQAGLDTAQYKDASELVTAADLRSDAAILSVFESRFPAIDPEISFRLEESGLTGAPSSKQAGADPLDGTNHFASGGVYYSVQAHYVENGVPLAGVVFQPEVFLPLAETGNCVGRLAWATRGAGAFAQQSRYIDGQFALSEPRRVTRQRLPEARAFVACVPLATKMTLQERERVRRVHDSGLISVTTGVGGAGGNVMMTIFGGQHVYANFGAGDDLDLIPPQIIAEEAGLTVWGIHRSSPRWEERKQPVVVAPNPEIAERFLKAAGL